MYSTTDDQGLLNNFAKETKVYHAEAPSQEQKRSYVIQGVFASLLVGALALVTFVVS
ncbi:MAG: ssl1498 family light-harvesting-like protein [Oscillatoria sp. PMC 1068.18]|nr:ssl1498 family light-harvesting-like protein [Oscillatoria sp. PMC 1076.18]MEC4987773.1 ssl1498 family light-harvesting-like protein [Oscillatoria sp. PMC 1068.18]